MKILITGGAGFIGSHVVEAYLSAGHDVVVVDDLSTGSKKNLPAGVPFYLMNIGSPELAKVFELEKPQVVNHHAAQISVTISAREPMRDATVNGLGLLNVLECSRAAGVKKFIFISSGGAVYGEAGSERLTEDHPPSPVSPYAIHKLLGEHYLKFYGLQYGLDWTALRY
jgi:UDP-glucose 4-epimerase